MRSGCDDLSAGGQCVKDPRSHQAPADHISDSDSQAVRLSWSGISVLCGQIPSGRDCLPYVMSRLFNVLLRDICLTIQAIQVLMSV